MTSKPFDINQPGELKSVLNFIVTILETSLRSSPTVNPIKNIEEANEEKVYEPYVPDADEDDDDYIDLPTLDLSD